MIFFWLVASIFIFGAYSMPYHAPLHGKVGGKRTLIILDNLEMKTQFQIFFDDLEKRGHELTLSDINSNQISLKTYGEYNFDNIILFAPSFDKSSFINFKDLLQFSDDNGNILIAANDNISDDLRNFVEYLGISLDKKGSRVIDHFSNIKVSNNIPKDLNILANNFADSKPILGDFLEHKSPIIYSGIAHSVEDEILITKTLTGNPSTYSYFPSKALTSDPLSSSQKSTLVSSIQGRNNARIVFSGSLDLFSNKFFGLEVSKNKVSGNRKFCQEISKWNFAEKSVLRFRDITHHKSDGTPPDVILHEKKRPDLPHTLYPDPEITRNSLVYRIKDEIVYSMIVEEFNGDNWVPFTSDDMQMEFVMLDPYVRKTMKSDPQSGKFTAVFIAPDNYGVFKFRVLYRRPGYSIIHAETQVSIRPFKHDEYERFIFSAFPYYASVISAAVGFFLFVIAFLFTNDSK